MSQRKLVIKKLKQILKANGVHYVDIAKQLKLSEASVKRLFSQEDFTLERLETICRLAHIELNELFAQINSPVISQLTEEQEAHIVSDVKLLLIAVCVVNSWTLKDILENYNISYYECIQKLVFLDKCKLIELLPKDRLKLKISTNFAWLPNGPIQKFFQRHLENDFLQSPFSKKEEAFVFRFGMLTEESNILLRKKLQEFSDYFTHLVQQDFSIPITSRDRCSLLMAFRPWVPKLFDKYRKAK